MAVFWLGDQPTACKCLPIIVVHSAVDPQPVELFYSGTEASICWFYQTSPTQRIRCYLRAVRRHALYYLVRHDNSTLARSVPSATQHPWLRASRSWMGNSVLIVHLKGDCCSNRGMHSSRSVTRAYPRAWSTPGLMWRPVPFSFESVQEILLRGFEPIDIPEYAQSSRSMVSPRKENSLFRWRVLILYLLPDQLKRTPEYWKALADDAIFEAIAFLNIRGTSWVTR